MDTILANRLVLNLRSHAESERDESSVKSIQTDIFFRMAYGPTRRRGLAHTVGDSILGNIGEPLRVEEEDILDVEENEGFQLDVIEQVGDCPDVKKEKERQDA